MKSQLFCLLALNIAVSSIVFGQPARRWAVMAAHGPASSNPGIALAEARVTDNLTSELTGLPGVALIDRASLDRVLKEQNFQNSDRSSPDTAARIGKLLGCGQMILVQVYDASYSTHAEHSGMSTKTMGTVVLRANARIIDVETGVIQAQPTSAFQESVLVSQKSATQGFHVGMINVPARQSDTGGDPKVIEDNEWAKASESVSKELAAKISGKVGGGGPGMAVAAAVPMEPAIVAGIVSGAVYINKGSNAGVKAGDRFQIIREVSLGLEDPTTGKPMTKKQKICVLTITSADEGNSSGSCQGGLPQSKDMAQPITQ